MHRAPTRSPRKTSNNGSFTDTANATSKEAKAPPAEDTIKGEQTADAWE